MLTISKPVQYGYRPVHDLPTPPSTSRPSPPLSYLDPGQKPQVKIAGGRGPSDQLMSAPHRGLPLPAALPPVQPPPGSGPSGPPPSLSIGQAAPPPPPSQSQTLGQLPPAPPWHEESMRAWLAAKAEEDKRRQEEERTRQESYRLEQRRMEHEILRTSLQGGIPPPLVPVVFAGMGGGALSPTALDWAQQFMVSQSPQQQQPPALMPPGTVSPEHHRRDSQAQLYGQYSTSGGVPSTPGSAQGPPSAFMSAYPGSPTRPRGQSMPGSMAGRSFGGGQSVPSLNTNVPGGSAVAHQHQQEPQPSPSIYFHHWQPPTTQAGGRSGSDQPATPSVGESPRKRKAAGPQQPAPPPTTTTQRHRSPPFSHSTTGLSNPPPGRRRGHSRQRSDVELYRPGVRGRAGSSGPGREMSPMHTSGPSSSRDSGGEHQQQVPPPAPRPAQGSSARTGPHSVSSLLSDPSPQPSLHSTTTTHFAGGDASESRHVPHQQQQHHHHHHHHHHQQPQHPQQQQQQQFSEGGPVPEERPRGGAVQGSAATRPGDNH